MRNCTLPWPALPCAGGKWQDWCFLASARVMRRAPRQLCCWIFHQLARLLRREDQFHQMPTMAFFIEEGLMVSGEESCVCSVP
uniref:Uncharacterized protein n=1 Tax=Apteryx owenii TaxID=8824 RepID=A0A8B9SAJ2_APTOW